MKRLIALLALAGCAGAPTGSVEQAIVNGSLDTTDTSVVVLQANGSELCTAEIISPHVALTAAHCSLEPVGTAYSVMFTNDIKQPGPTIAVTAMHHDPAFNRDNIDGGHDVAVALLAEPAPVPPMSYNRVPIPMSWKDPYHARGARLVGFGIATATNSLSYGQRRQIASRVYGLRDGVITFRTIVGGLLR